MVGFATGARSSRAPASYRIDPATLRLIADSAGSHLTDADLAELVENWAKVMAEQGYDVHGDLAAPRRRTPAERAAAARRRSWTRVTTP